MSILCETWMFVPPVHCQKGKMTEENNTDAIVTRSPIPTRKPVELTFPDAIREVINGKRITRLAWETNDSWGELKDGYLMIFIRGEYHVWSVNDGDLFAIDWVVLPQQN
jgi:hypothetical protein